MVLLSFKAEGAKHPLDYHRVNRESRCTVINFLLRVWCRMCRRSVGLTFAEPYDHGDKIYYCLYCDMHVLTYVTYYGDEPSE